MSHWKGDSLVNRGLVVTRNTSVKANTSIFGQSRRHTRWTAKPVGLTLRCARAHDARVIRWIVINLSISSNNRSRQPRLCHELISGLCRDVLFRIAGRANPIFAIDSIRGWWRAKSMVVLWTSRAIDSPWHNSLIALVPLVRPTKPLLCYRGSRVPRSHARSMNVGYLTLRLLIHPTTWLYPSYHSTHKLHDCHTVLWTHLKLRVLSLGEVYVLQGMALQCYYLWVDSRSWKWVQFHK